MQVSDPNVSLFSNFTLSYNNSMMDRLFTEATTNNTNWRFLIPYNDNLIGKHLTFRLAFSNHLCQDNKEVHITGKNTNIN